MRATRIVAVALAGLVAAGCGSVTVLSLGPPVDRYDHNRTRPVSVPASEGARAIRLTNEALAPQGSAAFPRLDAVGGRPADGLPAANLTPVFTGVPLPLSAEPAPGGRGDRDDLVDFLASGPNAQAGVEPPDTQGNLAAAERCYAPVLELLASPARLARSRPGIVEWATCCEVAFADVVVDSRYPPAAFAEVVAFRYRRYWFALYRFPRSEAFSRVVVAPVKITRQDFEAKTAAPGC